MVYETETHINTVLVDMTATFKSARLIINMNFSALRIKDLEVLLILCGQTSTLWRSQGEALRV